jgi:hypothetical protein
MANLPLLALNTSVSGFETSWSFEPFNTSEFDTLVKKTRVSYPDRTWLCWRLGAKLGRFVTDGNVRLAASSSGNASVFVGSKVVPFEFKIEQGLGSEVARATLASSQGTIYPLAVNMIRLVHVGFKTGISYDRAKLSPTGINALAEQLKVHSFVSAVVDHARSRFPDVEAAFLDSPMVQTALAIGVLQGIVDLLGEDLSYVVPQVYLELKKETQLWQLRV